MAQPGPLLASVLRLVRELESSQIWELPAPPLPVRLWEETDAPGLRLDLHVSVEHEGAEQALIPLSQRGMRVTSWTRSTVVGWTRVENLDDLLELSDDLLIEAAPVVRPALDVTVPEAWDAPVNTRVSATGAGVIVGIVDSGIDVTHPDFIGPNGATRVLHLWDQRVRAGSVGAVPYGSEWDAVDIDAHRGGGSSAAFASLDPTGHGTGVAGVAAGNGGKYAGVAPEADLIVVALEARRSALPSTANVVDAIEYVFAHADALGRRAVVNLSLGSAIGPHDPKGFFELSMTGVLANSDRILVVSSGNEGTAGRHARVAFVDSPVDIEIFVPSAVGPLVLADVWYDLADLLDVQVIAPGGIASPIVDGGNRDVGQLGQDMYEIDSVLNFHNVRANNVQVKLRTASRTGDVTAGRWLLRLSPRYTATAGIADAWLDVGLYRSPEFGVPDVLCTATSPAAADEVIVVGSYEVGPVRGQLSATTGRGPDRHGLPPTLVAAPGDPVTTCDADPSAGRRYAQRSGTSYAAPHVTGAVALLLERHPSLSRYDVVQCLVAGARTDPDTAAGPVEAWGAGKLDIDAVLGFAAANFP